MTDKAFEYKPEAKLNTLHHVHDALLASNVAPMKGSFDFQSKEEVRTELKRQFLYAIKHKEFGHDPATGKINFTLRHMGDQKFFDYVEGAPLFETIRDFFEDDNWDSVGFRHVNGAVLVSLESGLLINPGNERIQDAQQAAA